MNSTVDDNSLAMTPGKEDEVANSGVGAQSDLFGDSVEATPAPPFELPRPSDDDGFSDRLKGRLADHDGIIEKLKYIYRTYPRLSKTFLASIVVHAIIIFYMPPQLVTLIFGPPGNAKQQRPISIVLKGDIGDLAKAQKEGQQDGEEQGEFNGGNGKWADLLKRLQENAELTQSFPQKYEDLLSNRSVGDSYVHRDRKHQDIVVKEVFPTIYEIDKPFKDILAAAPKKLDEYLERNEVIEQYRDWRMGKPDQPIKLNISSDKKGKLKRGPLKFPKNERSQYFDDTLTQSKEAQLSNFIRQYFSYDPDKGDLPIATRELYYDNLQRLAYPFSSDPTYFYLDYYLENLNKEDFLNHSIYQASQLDGSKTQTELLFALQDIYHIQERAWNYYFNFESMYKVMPADKKNRLRNETLRRVDERYKKILEQKHISDYKEIRDLYSKKRMEIMDYILEKSPGHYRNNDALFEKAAIEWEWGTENNDPQHMQNAVTSWLQLYQSLGNNAAAQHNDDEFLNHDALLRLAPMLQRYQMANNDLEKRALQVQIDQTLTFRFQQRLQAKRAREEQILWPRNKPNDDNSASR